MIFQILSLLIPIITVISSLLSLNEKISNQGIIKTIKILLLYLLPILFIQQILQVAYLFKTPISRLLLILPITTFILLLILFYIKKLKFKKQELLYILIMLINSLLFAFQPYCLNLIIDDFLIKLNDFFIELSDYNISYNMYVFLSNNLFYVFANIIDVATIILFVFLEILTGKYYFALIMNNIFEEDISYPDLKSKTKNYIILFLLSSGCIHKLIELILELF